MRCTAVASLWFIVVDSSTVEYQVGTLFPCYPFVVYRSMPHKIFQEPVRRSFPLALRIVHVLFAVQRPSSLVLVSIPA